MHIRDPDVKTPKYTYKIVRRKIKPSTINEKLFFETTSATCCPLRYAILGLCTGTWRQKIILGTQLYITVLRLRTMV
jgi:hypothetical protein